MSDPNPFGDPAELSSRAFPDATDGTVRSPLAMVADAVTQEPATPVTEISDETLDAYTAVRKVNERVRQAMANAKVAQGDVKYELDAGVELGIPKWVMRLAIKVQDLDETQRAEFWHALDLATKSIGVGNTQTTLF